MRLSCHIQWQKLSGRTRPKTLQSATGPSPDPANRRLGRCVRLCGLWPFQKCPVETMGGEKEPGPKGVCHMREVQQVQKSPYLGFELREKHWWYSSEGTEVPRSRSATRSPEANSSHIASLLVVGGLGSWTFGGGIRTGLWGGVDGGRHGYQAGGPILLSSVSWVPGTESVEAEPMLCI